MGVGRRDDGYVPGRRDDVGLLVGISAAGAALAVLGSTLFASPTPPPPPSDLRGCFTAADAPSLFLDGRRLRIGQTGMPPTPYRLQWAKPGILDLVTEAPLSLEPLGRAYVYERGVQRTIVFAHLRHTIDGRALGVVRGADAEYLDVLSSEMADVRYDRAGLAACTVASPRSAT